MKPYFTSLAVIISSAVLVHAEPVTIELPVETGVYRAAPGADLANAQCLTCHSADYAAMQPPMPRAFWKGSVEKMIGKYGAPIPAGQVEALADYFAQNYGTGGTNHTATPTTQKGISVAAVTDAKQLMQKSGCFNCHTIDKKLIGPAFKDIAGKYKGNAEGIAKVSHQITHGGAGLWGPFPMPPYKQFSDAEVKTLAEWVLRQN